MIVGLISKIGGGKDTVAQMVQELYPELNWQIKGFADKLRQVASLLTGIPAEEMKRQEEEAAKVNVLGFMAMADTAVNYFLKCGAGTLVGISSVAGHRGSGRSPAYNASKAFMINYMEGLRQKLFGTRIKVVDIRPGFVDTAMIRGNKGLFGVVTAERAVADIYRAIRKGKRIAYVPGWWGLFMWFAKRIPEWIYHSGYRRYLAWDKKARAAGQSPNGTSRTPCGS